jgi:predicted nucleic acid-binding protein
MRQETYSAPVAESVVLDASVIVDLLAVPSAALPVRRRLKNTAGHAPAHIDAEVLSAIGRLHRAGIVDDRGVENALLHLEDVPVARHPLPGLLLGAWRRRESLRLVDALYVELAAQLDISLITTDRRLARVTPLAEVIDLDRI